MIPFYLQPQTALLALACLCAVVAPTAAGQAKEAPAHHQQTADSIKITDCWIRHMRAPTPSGGFLHVHNAGDQPITLTGAESPDYGKVMMHQTTQKDGMSKMAMVSEIPVPVGGDVAFKPGGYHLMLEQARDGLHEGDAVDVEFHVADGASVSTTCTLKAPGAMPDSMSHGHHS